MYRLWCIGYDDTAYMDPDVLCPHKKRSINLIFFLFLFLSLSLSLSRSLF